MGKIVQFPVYKTMTLWQVVSMAIDNNVEIENPHPDLDIVRMQYIAALRKAGVLK